MAAGQLSKVVARLRDFAQQDVSGIADGDLMKRYVRQRDDAAFEALVRRHGPMVMGVCCRVLHNVHDAEDAFQATFLLLARKAATLCSPGTVGNWLYGVAYRTALEARRATARRRAKEAGVVIRDEASEDTWAELRPVLDQELGRLPEKYRAVVVLCDLEGKTRKEAAQHLGWPEGTVASRLAAARTTLAKQLVRHGFAVSGGGLAVVLSRNASACVPPAVVSSTVKAASLVTAGKAAAAAAISPTVAALMEGVMKAMLFTKLRPAIALVLMLGLVATGAAVLSCRASAEQDDKKAAAEKPAEPAARPEKDKGKPADAQGILVEAVRAARDIKAPDDEARRRKVDLLVSLAQRQEKAGDRTGAATTFKDALTVAGAITDGEQRAEAQSHIGFYQAHAGFVKEAAETAKGIAIPEGKLEGDALKHRVEGLQGHVLAEIAAHLAITGKCDEALATAETIAVRVLRFKSKDKDKVVERRDTAQRDLAYQHIARAQLKAGKTDEAFKTLARIEVWRGEVFLYQDVLLAHCKGKDLATARKLVAAFQKEMERREVSAATRHHVLADVQGALGDAAGAIEWIEKLGSPQARAEALMGLSIGLSRAEARSR